MLLEYLLNPVHFRQHLGQNTIADFSAGAAAPLRSQCINFIKEYDAGRHTARFGKECSDSQLGVTNPLAEQLGALDGDKVELAFVGKCLCNHCLRTT
jgi:hypothetical protein